MSCVVKNTYVYNLELENQKVKGLTSIGIGVERSGFSICSCIGHA